MAVMKKERVAVLQLIYLVPQATAENADATEYKFINFPKDDSIFLNIVYLLFEVCSMSPGLLYPGVG